MDQQNEILEEVVIPPAVDLTELETKLTDLVEVLETEQELKQAEKEQQQIEAEKLAKEQEAQAKLDAENQKIVEQQQQADVETVEEFRANVLKELQLLNENVQHYEELSEAIIEHQKVEMELYNAVYFASIAVIVAFCIMPSIWVVRMFKNALKSFI